jgi:hypothetical protein
MSLTFPRRKWWQAAPWVVALLACTISPLHAQVSADGSEANKRKLLEMVRVADGGKGFVLAHSGEPFMPWGFNYLGDSGRIVEEYWAKDWPRVEKDFRQMRDLGANVVRLHLQLGTYMKTPKDVDRAELQRLKGILDLGGRFGLYLDLTGLGCYHRDAVPSWYDELSEADRWQVQSRFWEAVAETCAGHPAVFCYDLMNEPVIGKPAKGEHPWLLGELGGCRFVQRISNDPRNRTSDEIAAAWVKELVTAIRKHDQRHLVTVGDIPWSLPFPGAKPIFYSPEAAKHLDFLSVHFYPNKGEVDRALSALAVYDLGKPIVIEETYPLSCSIRELNEFIDKSTHRVDGWISHYFGRTIKEHADANPSEKDVATFLEYWRKKRISSRVSPAVVR